MTVDKLCASYLYKRDGTYYFSKHVPYDVKHHYRCKRIVMSLRTKSASRASRACQSLLQRLEDYWLSLRLSDSPLPAGHMLMKNTSHVGVGITQSNDPTLNDALILYLRLKSEGKSDTFVRGAKRNIGFVVSALGDRPIDMYSSSEAASVRDKWIENGLTISSIKRNFSTIRSIINLTISEHGLNCSNAFARTYMPEEEKQKRLAVPLDAIRQIQSDCRKADDDRRWLVSLLSDSGMRLGEAAGLAKEDIKLDEDIPFVDLKPHSWRSLKTSGSKRHVPLIGEALWAVKQAMVSSDSPYLFPRYVRKGFCNANSASAALNKWLKPRVPEGCVIHSFRHSMRDRLRAEECPSEIIDAIGGWISAGVGNSYGDGYPLEVKHKWMNKIILFMNQS